MARLTRLAGVLGQTSSKLVDGPVQGLHAIYTTVQGTVSSKFFIGDPKHNVKRWFGETAALEEIYTSASSGKESLGFSKTVDANPGQSLKKLSDEAENKVVSEMVSVVNKSGTRSGASISSSGKLDTEKLTEYIIGKYKSNASNDKGFLNKKPTGHHPSSKLHFPQGRTNTPEDNKNNWKEVLEDLCGRGSKNKAASTAQSTSNQSRSFGRSESDPNDDFADLDLPQLDKASVSVSPNSSHRPPLAAALKKEPTISSRQVQFQDSNQQKAKETKSANYEFSQSTQEDMSERSVPKREDIPIFTREEAGHRVCIMNLPVSSNLALVRDALSIYGEVTGSYKKPTPNGSCATYIEFKTYEAKEEALAARFVQLENKVFTILRVDRPLTTVVRVCKVNSETTESHVLSTCGKFGGIDIIKRRGNGIFDVYYNMRELPNIPKILDSLNDVTFQHNRWLAKPAPLLHPEVKENVLKRKDGQAWQLAQMSRLVKRIETGLDNVAVWFEDLKTLYSMEEESRQS